MRVDFPYAKEKSRLLGTTYRPVARVVLNRRYPNYMYVDSGADISLLPRSVGDLIGLSKVPSEKPELISGVGGTPVKVLMRKVSMILGTVSFQARVAWSLSEHVPMLLGRLDVFDRFRIVFREKERIVSFMAEDSTM
ncbi:MAG TPA: hypothetical protein VFE98_02525 [Candidatus Bathyarchaeia archaeon]|nr:hypothetical protein [Candidatus Bathyarchaeia archaeon]